MQGDAVDVDRRLEQLRRDSFEQHGRPAIRRDQLPAGIDDEGRVGVVPVEDQLERPADRRDLGLVEIALLERRRVPGGEQQPGAVAQRDLELLGETQDPGMSRLMELGRHASIWLDRAPETAYPRLEGERRYEVAVVGGGITGVTAALLLARAGLSVGLVDQHVVSGGTTGHSTAK